MKKILLLVVIGILFISGFGASALTINDDKLGNIENVKNENLNRGTHTVLAEFGTATDCPYCPSHETYLYQVQGDFKIVTLPCSHYTPGAGYNQAIVQRLTELGISGYPTSFWDGGYTKVVGGQTSVGPLQNAYNTCAARTVADVDLALSIYWLGNAQIQIDINVINNGSSTYNGHLHVYIMEIISRWYNYAGQKFKDALLDCPINEDIVVGSSDTYSDSITWDGNDYGYGDIVVDNIESVASVFTQSTKYADETIGALPNQNKPPNKPTITGPTSGDPNIQYDFTFTTTDNEQEDVYYWIEWGDNTNSGWVGPYGSGENAIINHIYANVGKFEIKAKAKDTNDGESSWSNPYQIIIGNFAPSEPVITGPTSGKIRTEIEYTFVATDPNGDDLLYTIKWGDGTSEDWFGPYNSGEEVKMSHSWNKEGTWYIEAMVKDPDGLESYWTKLAVNIPKTKNSFDQLFSDILQRFPIIFKIVENFFN